MNWKSFAFTFLAGYFILILPGKAYITSLPIMVDVVARLTAVLFHLSIDGCTYGFSVPRI
jgi:hypothetical protein